jgi:hypothetical protein
MRKIQSRVPLLSLAEKQMHSELQELQEKATEFSKNIQQVCLYFYLFYSFLFCFALVGGGGGGV